MSLVALLALSHPAAAASSEIADLHAQQRRRLPFRRRNSLVKVYGPNKKNRYRSLLAGFSVDGLLALDATSASTGSLGSRTRGAAMSLPVLLTAKSGLYASPQSALSAIVGSLKFWPAAPAAWRRKGKTPDLQGTMISSSQALVSPAGPGRPPLPTASLARRRSRSNRDDPKAPPRVQARPRRSSKSAPRPPLTPSSRPKQGQLRRAAQAANAQLSSELMAQKLETHGNNNNSSTSHDDDEISYEMDEEELATRFYVEIKSAEALKSRSSLSRASASAPQPFDHEPEPEGASAAVDAREREWRTKQLALERQVAALLAENHAKSALISYLMNENSRLVGDCECGVSTADTGASAAGNNHDDACAPTGRAQKRVCENPEDDGDDDGSFMTESTSAKLKSQRRDPSAPLAHVVHAAKRKLQQLDSESRRRSVYGEQQQPPPSRRASFVSVAANEAEFEGLVQEIEAEFSELFAFASC